MYTTKDGSGSASVQLKMNYPPVQQYCTIDPYEGTTNHSFTVNCSGWTDFDGIKDYSLHGKCIDFRRCWSICFCLVTSDGSDILMTIAYSKNETFRVRLPSGDPRFNHQLNLTVQVRDNLDAWTDSEMITIIVREIYQSRKKNFLIGLG